MRALLLTLALVTTSVWAGEVYRSVGADGTPIYSDVPTGKDAKPIYIAVQQPAGRPARPSGGAPSSAANNPDPSANGTAPGDESKPGNPTPAEPSDEKAKNCKIAQDRVQRYSVAHRLYRNGPNGEREYLSDAEIDEAKAQAAADVERWCK